MKRKGKYEKKNTNTPDCHFFALQGKRVRFEHPRKHLPAIFFYLAVGICLNNSRFIVKQKRTVMRYVPQRCLRGTKAASRSAFDEPAARHNLYEARFKLGKRIDVCCETPGRRLQSARFVFLSVSHR